MEVSYCFTETLYQTSLTYHAPALCNGIIEHLSFVLEFFWIVQLILLNGLVSL